MHEPLISISMTDMRPDNRLNISFLSEHFFFITSKIELVLSQINCVCETMFTHALNEGFKLHYAWDLLHVKHR